MQIKTKITAICGSIVLTVAFLSNITNLASYIEGKLPPKDITQEKQAPDTKPQIQAKLTGNIFAIPDIFNVDADKSQNISRDKLAKKPEIEHKSVQSSDGINNDSKEKYNSKSKSIASTNNHGASDIIHAIASNALLREKAYEYGKPIAKVEAGDLLIILNRDEKNGWGLVTHEKTGKTGYLRRDIDFQEVGR